MNVARERQLLAAATAGDDPNSSVVGAQKQALGSDDTQTTAKPKSRWMDDDDEEDDEEEDGDDEKNIIGSAAAGQKRRHSPPTHQGSNKAPRTINDNNDASRPPISAGMSMAERAQAELAEFRLRQAELNAAAAAVSNDGATENEEEEGDDGYLNRKRKTLPREDYMNASPDVSSPEEEQHIRREAADSPPQQQNDDDNEYAVPRPPPTTTRATTTTTTPVPIVVGDVGVDDLQDLSQGEEEEEQDQQQIENKEEEEDEMMMMVAGPRRPPPPSALTDTNEGDGYYYNQVEAYPEPDELSPGPEQQEEEKQEEEEENVAVRVVVKRHVSMMNECRSVDNYEKLNRISEGTYGVVYRARDRETGEICALKKVKLEKERDGFPLTSVREINVLLSLAHPSIVNVSEVVVGSTIDAVFMVMEYADHDLHGVMEKRMTQAFSIAEVKCLMRQLLSGIAYLHANWVIHRDLKTSNILYTNKGQLKICDFGLARQYGEPLKPYTHLVVTLWYRSPELLLGTKTYSTAVDVWSCGCIMAELLAKKPLFTGQNELTQIDLIFKTLGTPTPETWPGVENLANFKKFNFKGQKKSVLRQKFPAPGPVFDGRPMLSESGFDLLSGLLDLCPERRLSAQAALEHPWFREHPLPKDPTMMPTFPGTNENIK